MTERQRITLQELLAALRTRMGELDPPYDVDAGLARLQASIAAQPAPDPEDDVVTDPDKPALTAHQLAELLLSHRDNDVMVRIVDSPSRDLDVQPIGVRYDRVADQVVIEARRDYP